MIDEVLERFGATLILEKSFAYPFRFVERIQQWFVVVEFEQLVVIQFVLVLQWIFQRFVQRPLEFGTFFFASVVERGGTEQQFG